MWSLGQDPALVFFAAQGRDDGYFARRASSMGPRRNTAVYTMDATDKGTARAMTGADATGLNHEILPYDWRKGTVALRSRSSDRHGFRRPRRTALRTSPAMLVAPHLLHDWHPIAFDRPGANLQRAVSRCGSPQQARANRRSHGDQPGFFESGSRCMLHGFSRQTIDLPEYKSTDRCCSGDVADASGSIRAARKYCGVCTSR
jgi:hypothetical protein